MLYPLRFFMPFTYWTMRYAAEMRHEICRPILGTHKDDALIHLVYGPREIDGNRH